MALHGVRKLTAASLHFAASRLHNDHRARVGLDPDRCTVRNSAVVRDRLRCVVDRVTRVDIDIHIGIGGHSDPDVSVGTPTVLLRRYFPKTSLSVNTVG